MALNHPPSSDKTIRKIDIAQVRVTILNTLFLSRYEKKKKKCLPSSVFTKSTCL